MKITIIGAGNIGTAMAAMCSNNTQASITIFSTKPKLWSDTIEYASMNSDEYVRSKQIIATDDLEEAVGKADIVFITIPSFMRNKLISRLTEYVRRKALIVFVPGCGGTEFVCWPLIEKKCIIAGLDRVPCVARIQCYGKKVKLEWKKKGWSCIVSK